MKHFVPLLTIGLLFTFGLTAAAQATTEPRVVRVETADGVTLVGDFYLPAGSLVLESGFPTVIVFHQVGSNRGAARPLAEALTAAGYAVLAVDSPGVGDSGGAPASNRDAVVASVQVWFDWLAAQPEVQTNSIAMLGASIGGLQALAGCGAISACWTAISLSPPRDGYGITAEQVREALETQLRNRSALLLAATFDGYFTAAVREMAGWSRGELGVYIFRGAGHGEMLFTSFEHADRVIAHILDWLNEHRPPA